MSKGRINETGIFKGNEIREKKVGRRKIEQLMRKRTKKMKNSRKREEKIIERKKGTMGLTELVNNKMV